MKRLPSRADESGVATVMVVLTIPLILLFCVLAIDVANWFVQKRHLQTQADAAALAGAGAYRFPVCDDGIITDTALRYSGKGDSSGTTYNSPDDVKTPQSRVHAVINGPNYFGQSKPGESDLNGNPGPCTTKFVDVKMTDSGEPLFFDSTLPRPTINAQARVQLFTVTEAKKLLPIGVQEATPRKVRAFVVDETTGNEVASVVLSAHGSTGGIAQFDNDTAPLNLPLPPGTSTNLGVRLALSGATSTTCLQPLVACFDSTETTHGLSYLRTWSGTPDPNTGDPPVARSVYLSPGTCGNGSFNSRTTSCTIDVSAKVKWNPGVIAADLAPATSKTKLTAQFNGNSYPMTYIPATSTWTATGLTVPPNTIGPRSVDIAWEQKTSTVSGGDCTKNNPPKECSGTFTGVQRTFWNNPDDQGSRGGPISKLDVLDSSNLQQVSDLQRCTGCTASLIFEVGIKGSLSLAQPTDPPVALRVNANQSQSLQCDPAEGGSNGLENMLANGCVPRYRENTGETCGAKNLLWAGAQPWPCVALRTGDPPNATPRGLNRRILCNPAFGDAGNCSNNASATSCTHPNNWPNFSATDPRIIGVFLTPYGSFTGTGSETVPVIGFASFYITGYTAQGGGVNTPCDSVAGAGADQYSTTPVPSGNISGHYIKTVNPNDGGTGSTTCDFTTINQCVAVLVK